MTAPLTKSTVLAGLQCAKRLWLQAHEPHWAAPHSAFEQFLFEQGRQVGALARERFPGGSLIPGGRGALEATRAALAQGAPAVFEAAFAADGVHVVADVLRRRPAGWELIEVKSATRVKDEHLQDLAVQRHVLVRAGVPLTGCRLMHLNADCVYPDLSNLFRLEDVTGRVDARVDELPPLLARCRAALGRPRAPDEPIGAHCKKPYPCPFSGHCWADVRGRPLAFEIPRLSPAKREELRRRGVVYLEDLPPEFPLTDAQRAHVARAFDARRRIDSRALARRLDTLEYPVHFLDFETLNPAVPRFDGMRPYQHFPFQYSCHVLGADGDCAHRQYLHADGRDPRGPLLDALLSDVGPRGSVVVYHAPFERGVLTDLAAAFPARRGALEALIQRLWDQRPAFQHDYLDPAFGGSSSLKRVLPAVAPDLDYGALAVRDGAQAQAAWQRLVLAPEGAEKDGLIAALTAYCHLDTAAMLALHRALQAAAAA